MRYEGYMLVVKDTRVSKKFYEELLEAQVELDTGAHVCFQGGFFLLQEKDWLGFCEKPKAEPAYKHHSGELVFEVDDLDLFLRRLAEYPGVELLHPAKEHPWGRHAVRFYDPDGHVVEVGESMTLVVKRLLKQGMTPEQAAEKSEFPLAFVHACRAELEREQATPAQAPTKGS